MLFEMVFDGFVCTKYSVEEYGRGSMLERSVGRWGSYPNSSFIVWHAVILCSAAAPVNVTSPYV